MCRKRHICDSMLKIKMDTVSDKSVDNFYDKLANTIDPDQMERMSRHIWFYPGRKCLTDGV